MPGLPAAYAVAAIPARYALERGNWRDAAAIGEECPMMLTTGRQLC